VSSRRWDYRLYTWSLRQLTQEDYVKQKGKRNLLVPNDVEVLGTFELKRFGSEVSLYQLSLVVKVIDGAPVVRSLSLGLTEYATNTDRYKTGLLEPSLLDEDLRGLSLQSLSALLIAKVSLTSKLDMTFINDIEEFARLIKAGKQGLAWGDKPEPVFIDSKGVAWFKVFTYDSVKGAQNDLLNAPRRTASRPTHKQVAIAYNEAKSLGESVEGFLSDKFNSTPKTVQRWIKDAKEHGHLDKTKQGRPTRKVGS
jgi:hypothetical protein